MDFVPQIPRISISPPPPEDPRLEPTTPFSLIKLGPCEDDGFRPRHLTPPPTVTNFKRPLSPPMQDAALRKGLGSQQFQALLKSSRERSAQAVPKKELDLRKEIAVKAHKNKQAERRALFLSKVQAPPSPTATLTPNTPPDSPSIFHYTLPSPGLVSPLALFETLDEHDLAPNARVEHVDFRSVLNQRKPTAPKSCTTTKPLGLPSLDQISARLLPRAQAQQQQQASLQVPQVNQHTQDLRTPTPVRPSIGAGRLRLPIRAQPQPDMQAVAAPQHKYNTMTDRTYRPAMTTAIMATPSVHQGPELPQLQVTPSQDRISPFVQKQPTQQPQRHVQQQPTYTPVQLRQNSRFSSSLTETNLQVLNSRDEKAHAMLSTLKRRTAPSSEYYLEPPKPSTAKHQHQFGNIGEGLGQDASEDKLKWRRRSAPADVMARARVGFEHPVLAHPAGF